MKRLTIPFLFIFYIITLLNFNKSDTYIICIDPGHGGMDTGTTVSNINESDLVLEISLQLVKVLNQKGYITTLTRTTKESLCEDKFIKKEDMNNRLKIISNSSADIVLSIHLNYYHDNRYSGAQVFYSNTNLKSKDLAKHIQQSMPFTTRNEVYRDNIYLLNRTTVPACIIECGFMSNEIELAKLQDLKYQINLCESISYGLTKFIQVL